MMMRFLDVPFSVEHATTKGSVSDASLWDCHMRVWNNHRWQGAMGALRS